MKMRIPGHGTALSEAIRRYAQRRMATALGRYRHVVESTRVRLAGFVNGPRGRVDKHCLIEAHGPAMVPLAVRLRDTELYVAIDRAAGRIDHAVARRLARSHAPGFRR